MDLNILLVTFFLAPVKFVLSLLNFLL